MIPIIYMPGTPFGHQKNPIISHETLPKPNSCPPRDPLLKSSLNAFPRIFCCIQIDSPKTGCLLQQRTLENPSTRVLELFLTEVGQIALCLRSFGGMVPFRKRIHIPPNGKFGKSSTQKCRLVGDMLVPCKVVFLRVYD